MKKLLKVGVVFCLLCCLMTSVVYAGAKWFFNVSELRFTASTSGTLGMAYVPTTKGRIILITSHYAQDIQTLCDEVYTIKSGKIVSKER